MNDKIKKRDNTKDIGNLLRSRIIDRVTDKTFYIEEPLRSELVGHHVDVVTLETVVKKSATEDDLPLTNPMNRSDLFILALQDIHGEVLRSLFLQIYHSSKRMPIDYSPVVSELKASRNGLQEVEYRIKQMLYWKAMGLPTPYLLSPVRELDRNGEYAVGVLTPFWSGATHDLDILALRKRRDQIETLLKDEFLPSGERNKLVNEPAKLLSLEDEILLSVLNCISEFAVVGTEGLALHPEVRRDTMVLTREQYEHKVVDYFNIAYNWHCRIASNPGLKRMKPKMRVEFKRAIQPILSVLSNEDSFIYAQGDEFLHHYKFQTFFGDGRDRRKSGVFDADYACMNRIERSRAKTLLSHLVDADYDRVERLSGLADDELHLRLNILESGSVTKEKLAYLVLPNSSRLDFDLIAVYEAICLIGRAAADDLYNWRHKMKRQHKNLRYRNVHIDFPSEAPENVSLGGYNSREQIAKVTYRLNERLDRMISGKTSYGPIEDTGLMTGLKTIKEILGHFVLPVNLPMLPLTDNGHVD